ncbi:MAG: hypothetical protein IJZ34_01565 [Lachnospiraceae bacterium]|nr:hypothetical protein [Lachnospiraceae bacterium]
MANEENLRLIQKFHVAAETGLGLELYLKKHAVSDEISHGAGLCTQKIDRYCKKRHPKWDLFPREQDIAFSYNIKRIERLLFGEVALNEAGEAQ